MMSWAAQNPRDQLLKIGEYIGAFVTLTFDATAVGPAGSTVVGTTYDPTNRYTTNPAWSTKDAVIQAGSAVTGTTLFDAVGINWIVQAICVEDSADAQATATTTTPSGVVRASWNTQ